MKVNLSFVTSGEAGSMILFWKEKNECPRFEMYLSEGKFDLLPSCSILKMYFGRQGGRVKEWSDDPNSKPGR